MPRINRTVGTAPRKAELSAQERRDIEEAHLIADMGVPVFACPLDEEGRPKPPRGWETTPAGDISHRNIDRWKPGMALCAVMGVVFDVIDVDPQNGGRESFPKLLKAVEDHPPEIFALVATPSHGVHFYVASSGARKGTPFPGIDFQAGDRDGKGRGFVFLPPSKRPSKADSDKGTLRAYRWVWKVHPHASPWRLPWRPSSLLALMQKEAGDGGSGPEDGPSGRQEPDILKRAVLEAQPGKQRGRLLKLVQEYERRGYPPGAIREIMRDFLKEVPLYNPEWPWLPPGDPDKWTNNLLHKAGEVMPDGTEEELEGIRDAPRRAGVRLTRSFDEVEDELLTWIWPGYCAYKTLTQIDGEKGQGKSSVIIDIIARATTGRPMPGQEVAQCDPMDAFIFAEDIKSHIKKQLRAAGADLSRVHFPDPKWQAVIRRQKEASERKRGTKRTRASSREEEINLLLPYGADFQIRMVKETGATLVVWDPITDYMDERVSTNNDASIRRAIAPVREAVEEAGLCGLMIRHMNKDRKASASHRGGGTTAFQNVARFHMVTGVMPDEYADKGTFGLSVVDANYVKHPEGTLAYDIVDSDIKLDDAGNMVGKVQWRGFEDIDPDTLTRGNGGDGKPGPDPIKRTAIATILGEMGRESESWDSGEAKTRINQELVRRGFSAANKNTIYKAIRESGITPKQERSGYVWVWPRKTRLRRGSRA
jgi:hypothetical protein